VPVQEGLTWQDFRDSNRLSAFAMWKTRSWKAVGNFSETIGYEDWDWWIRALKMGMKYRVLSKPVYNYRIHESQQTNVMKGRYNEIVNELKLLHFN
jgi:GT2 family glycosyltransferase